MSYGVGNNMTLMQALSARDNASSASMQAQSFMENMMPQMIMNFLM